MTPEEKRKIYAALAAPFPEHCIQRTEGRVTGRGYDTTGIGYQYIANRLNEVVPFGWRAHRTVTVKEILRANGRPAFEAICDITLELGEWGVDGNFVVFAESLADGGHVASSEADARKGAYTNAFKKAAAFFGVGRQAYEGTLDDDNVPQEFPAEPAAPPRQTRPQPVLSPVHTSTLPTPPRTPAPPRSRLTSKQLSAIWALGRKLGHEQQALRAFVKQKFSVQPEFPLARAGEPADRRDVGAGRQRAGEGAARAGRGGLRCRTQDSGWPLRLRLAGPSVPEVSGVLRVQVRPSRAPRVRPREPRLRNRDPYRARGVLRGVDDDRRTVAA